MKLNIFWFRRDLRLDDNTGLYNALNEGLRVILIFIFDTNIIDELSEDDARISFIYNRLSYLNDELQKKGSSVYILKGDPEEIWNRLIGMFDINSVYINKDYEPYAIERDRRIETILVKYNISLKKFKDQVIFEEKEILKSDGKPYTVFTPYKNRWLQNLKAKQILISGKKIPIFKNFYQCNYPFPVIEETGFKTSSIKVKPFDLSVIQDYHIYRDIPAADKTSYLSIYLRFGTLSIRDIVKIAYERNMVFLSELIWREFFMQIIFNFPDVITENFKRQYDNVQWRNDQKEFSRWCNGETGYPIVDAGMRQLKESGYMHNRVRMITAGFLCKHLLIDWRWGEAFFAQKLLDYELSSNNGNWQWAAGTGCDAAPWFRIFNPDTQQKKFDSGYEYIKKWVPDFGKPGYPETIVDHDYARQRAISVYKSGIKFKLKNPGA
ncbi:MAG: DNA photolyase family protein [Bacteroidales bacterium]|jgi:deoxyribodipyrimidine photo-lyase|nr:DNA photolyase family protein [Bacteroidales bacterium]